MCEKYTRASAKRPPTPGVAPVTRCQTATRDSSSSGDDLGNEKNCREAAKGGAKRRPLDESIPGSGGDQPETTGSSPTGRCSTQCIAALQVDGNTQFILRRSPADRDLWAPEFEQLVRSLRRARGQEQHRRERVDGISVVLPIGGVDVRGSATVFGTRREAIRIQFPDRSCVRFNADRNEMTIQAKAPALWGEGLRCWMAEWLDSFGWLLTGRRCTPENAWTVGWRTHTLEVASDFIGFPLRRQDAGGFTGRAGNRSWERLNPDGPHVETAAVGDRIEAIAVGRRKSPFSLYIYSKTAELRAHGKKPSESVYAPTWKESSAAIDDEEIVRVELRFTRRGLRRELVDLASGAATHFLDLTRPDAVLNRSNLSVLWASETERIRLVTPTGSARRRRGQTDERWRIVQRAAGVAPCATRQARAVRQLTHTQRKKLAARSVVKGSATFAALHGIGETDPETLKRAACLAIDDAPVLDGRFNLEAYADRLKANHGFVQQQCREARPTFTRRLRSVTLAEWSNLSPTAKLRVLARQWRAA